MLWDCAAPLETRWFLLLDTLSILYGWCPIKGPEPYEIRCDGREFSFLSCCQPAAATLTQVYTRTDSLKTLLYVEAMQKQPLRPCGSSVKYDMKCNNISHVAYVRTVDAEMFLSKASDSQQNTNLFSANVTYRAL